MEKQINEKIREIVQSVNETIPVVWDNLFINISLAFDGGEVYYFFNEEGKNEYIYNLYVPKQYNFPNNTENIGIEKIIEQIKGNLPNQGVILND